MKIGLFNRYWNTFGGGEKYSGIIAETLCENHDVDLIGTTRIQLDQLESRMNLKLARANRVVWPDLPCAYLGQLSNKYDLFLNSAHRSTLVSQAKDSVYICFFPEIHPSFLASYSRIIAISEFTKSWIRSRWGRDSILLHPPIDTEIFAPSATSPVKEKKIVSVGRFFAFGHNKKHLEMIEAFRKMVDSGAIPRDWEYHLIGKLHLDSPYDTDYFDRVQKLAQGYPIRILPDLSLPELIREYQSATIFWHATGWNEEDTKHPERLEHFGMTTCEAMSAGCVPIVIAKAGQLEIVRDGIDGFLFTDENDLIDKTRKVVQLYGSDSLRQLSRAAREAMGRLNKASFRNNVLQIFPPSG